MPSPATASTPEPEPAFDPLAFWIQYKTRIQILAALLVFGLLAFGIFQFTERRAREAAARDYAAAKTADDFRHIIQAHVEATERIE